MAAGELTSVKNRLKREECNHTKHDSNFSHWEILIGPSDWGDYSKGKEGSSRYRIHNLPQESGPGVYELAVAVWSGGLGRDIYKLAPHRILVVYVGQADNVRARLQNYGRTGAHLGNAAGASIFQHIFSQGSPILYRWVPMQNKKDAMRTEDQLLSTFDYAWNTSNNGIRRPDDILQKLNKIASGTKTFSDMAKVLLPFTQRQVGIPIKSSKLPQTNHNKSDEEDNGSYNFLSRVFKFNRSRPRIVQDISEAIQENDKICGVALGDGTVCRTPPAARRKRCLEHKGMRTNVSTAKAIGAPKSESIVVRELNLYCQTKGNGYRDHHVVRDVQENDKICGVALGDGTVCRTPPAARRKRCLEHKGMRTNVSTAKAISASKSESIVVRELNLYCQTKGNGYRDHHVVRDVQDPPQTVVESLADGSISNTNICGIILDDGSTCRRQPVKGRKRCLEHKGKRNRASVHINH